MGKHEQSRNSSTFHQKRVRSDHRIWKSGYNEETEKRQLANIGNGRDRLIDTVELPAIRVARYRLCDHLSINEERMRLPFIPNNQMTDIAQEVNHKERE